MRAGETVTVSYTKGTNPLKDLASNEAPALTDHAVKNNTVRTPPAEVTGFSAKEGVVSVTLLWDAPASDADITHHEYRFKTDGSYPDEWTEIDDSAPGGANEAGYRVEDLTAGTAHTFELRAVNDAGAGDADETKPVTPTAALPPNPHSTNFYLWSTTLTVGESSGYFGYEKTSSLGSINTGAKFNYPPWSPPHKHHFDPDYRFAVDGLYFDPTGGTDHLILEIDDTGGSGISVGNLTLWIGNTSFPLGSLGGTSLTFGFDIPDVPDLDWKEGDKVRVVLSYERRLPSAPQNVSVMVPPGEGGTLAVSWEEPEFGGTFPIECYLVEFRHPSGDVNKRKQSYPGSRGTGKGCGKEPPTSVKRTDLEPGVRYEVLVQALSGDGFGEWSDMKTAPRTIRGRALGARFVSPPERHDGEKRIKVRVAFSEAPENVGADGVEVEGGAVTSVRPVGGNAPGGAGTGSKSRSVGARNAGQQDREVVWEFEIEPDSDGDVTVSLGQLAPDLQERSELHRRGLAHRAPEQCPLDLRIKAVAVLDDVGGKLPAAGAREGVLPGLGLEQVKQLRFELDEEQHLRSDPVRRAPGAPVPGVDPDLQMNEAVAERRRHPVHDGAVGIPVAAGDQRGALGQFVLAALPLQEELVKRGLDHRHRGRQLFQVEEPQVGIVRRRQEHRRRPARAAVLVAPGDTPQIDGVEQ